jgi:hypothetical protein
MPCVTIAVFCSNAYIGLEIWAIFTTNGIPAIGFGDYAKAH